MFFLKKSKEKIFLMTFLMIIFCSLSISASRYYLETDNFNINFQKEHEEIAYYIADLAEEIHQDLQEFMGYIPEQRTYIIISDDFDTANAAAAPFYYNRIYLYLQKPDIYGGMVGYYKSWLRVLLTHEYTHILHLDMNKGNISDLRRVLGKVPFISTPNFLQPWWMIEGYAMYAETQFSEGGRGANDLNDMHIRAAIAEDKLYRIDQFHGPYDLGSWPSGNRAIYYYGLSIFEYLADTYGEDKLVEISHVFSRDPAQSINKVFEETLGRDINQVYYDWQARQTEEMAAIYQGLSLDYPQPERLTTHGWNTLNPAVSPVTGELAYFHYGKNFPGLRLLDSEGQNRHLQTTFNPAGEGIAWSPDGSKLVYPELNYYDAKSLYYDLYLYNIETERKERITRGKRAYSPVWQDENTIIFLTQEKGETDLIKKDLQTGQSQLLLEGSTEKTYSQLAISADGSYLLMSIWHQGKRDIYLFDLAGEELRPVIVDDYINIHPEWVGEKNDKIIFSSDRSKRFNLFLYDLQEDKLFQLTDVPTGAFEPVVRTDQEIIFIGYSASGFDLKKIPYNRDQWKEVVGFQSLADGSALLEDVVFRDEKGYRRDYRIYNYQPLNTLQPRFLVPIFRFSYSGQETRVRLGLITGGVDALQNHQYQLNFQFDNALPTPAFRFDYIYNRDSSPYFSSMLQIRHDHLLRQGYIFNRRNYTLGFNYPLARDYFYFHDLYLNFIYREIENYQLGKTETRFFLTNPGWRFAHMIGRDSLTNVFNFDINYATNPFRDDDDFQLEMELKNRFIQGDSYEIAARFFAGYSQLFDYSSGNFKYVRTPFPVLENDLLAVFNIEYRRKLKRINSGSAHLPLFFRNLNGTIFYDRSYLPGNSTQQHLEAGGIELGLEMDEMYGLSSGEIVIGLNTGGNFYFRLGKFF